jgi:hypothetical protein
VTCVTGGRTCFEATRLFVKVEFGTTKRIVLLSFLLIVDYLFFYRLKNNIVSLKIGRARIVNSVEGS